MPEDIDEQNDIENYGEEGMLGESDSQDHEMKE